MKEIFIKWKSEKIMDCHKRQLETPYRSTIHFEKFLTKNTTLNNYRIIDIACGAGGSTRFLADLYSNSKFLDIDLNEQFKEYFSDEGGVTFEVEDLNNMDRKL